LNRLSQGLPLDRISKMSTVCWEPGKQITLPNSQCLEEAASPMPSISQNDLELRDRVSQLEATIKTYPDSMVTWKQLCVSLIGAAVAVIGLWLTSSYQLRQDLNKRFEGYDNAVSTIKTDVAAIKSKLEHVSGNNNPFLTSGTIAAALKSVALGNPASLLTELPNFRDMLAIVKEKKIAIPDKDYKQISDPLLSRLEKADPNLKQELWSTYKALATTKNSTYTVFHRVPPAELAKAKAVKGGYRENETIDLSKNSQWKDTIFKNCKITIGDPYQTVTLKDVRFIEVDFESLPQNVASQTLLASVLKSTGPTISKVLEAVSVEYRGPVHSSGRQSKSAYEPSELTASRSRARSGVR